MKSTYYYIANGEQKGPITLEELLTFVQRDTMIWHPGMSDWKPASEVEEIAPHLGSSNTSCNNVPVDTYNESNTNKYITNHNGYSYNSSNDSNKPNNYLVWSILLTLLCCMPFGVVSIIYSTKVDRCWKQGDNVGAQEASDNCKKFLIWGAIIGFIINLLYFGLNIASLRWNQ